DAQLRESCPQLVHLHARLAHERRGGVLLQRLLDLVHQVFDFLGNPLEGFPSLFVHAKDVSWSPRGFPPARWSCCDRRPARRGPSRARSGGWPRSSAATPTAGCWTSGSRAFTRPGSSARGPPRRRSSSGPSTSCGSGSPPPPRATTAARRSHSRFTRS